MIDHKRWRRAEATEVRGRQRLAAAAANWTAIEKMLVKKG
jgi:hypothetical protein